MLNTFESNYRNQFATFSETKLKSRENPGEHTDHLNRLHQFLMKGSLYLLIEFFSKFLQAGLPIPAKQLTKS